MITPLAKTCRILSIDGGGIRGVIPATILAALEEKLGGPLARHFHVLAGTSTGGILAAGLAHEIPATKLVDFYAKDGPSIFAGSILSDLNGPKYGTTALEGALKTAFGTARLSDLKHDLICPAYDIEARSDHIFEAWAARGVGGDVAHTRDFDLWEVARSTSAAPTYFPPMLATAGDDKKYPLIDGGMFANNPAMLGFVSARRLMPLAQRYLVLSIGTGEAITPIKYTDAQGWGIVGWGGVLIDVIFDAMGATVDYELDQTDIVKHVRLQTSLVGASDALDDASAANLKNLATCAQKTLTSRAADIDALIAELKRPIDDKVAMGYPKANAPARPSTIAQFPILKIKAAAVTQSVTQAVTAPAQAPTTTWAVGGTAAGALTGAAFGGPIGLLIGAALGYVGGRLAGGAL